MVLSLDCKRSLALFVGADHSDSVLVGLDLLGLGPEGPHQVGPGPAGGCGGGRQVRNNKNERKRLLLLAVQPLGGPAQLVGVPEVEVEGRDPQVLPHHPRHVHIVHPQGRHLSSGLQGYHLSGFCETGHIALGGL